jgi:hypothetical protein
MDFYLHAPYIFIEDAYCNFTLHFYVIIGTVATGGRGSKFLDYSFACGGCKDPVVAFVLQDGLRLQHRDSVRRNIITPKSPHPHQT